VDDSPAIFRRHGTLGGMDDIATAPAIHTDDDLHDRWRLLLGHGGFRGRQLWLLWFDAQGHQLPVVMPVEDLAERPDRLFVDNLSRIVADVVAQQAPGGSVAMALARSGASSVQAADRAWARALYERAAATELPMRRLHLATPGSVRPLVLDDLG
jgi:hypothetical protein